jgi:hypothetical protein
LALHVAIMYLFATQRTSEWAVFSIIIVNCDSETKESVLYLLE